MILPYFGLDIYFELDIYSGLDIHPDGHRGNGDQHVVVFVVEFGDGAALDNHATGFQRQGFVTEGKDREDFVGANQFGVGDSDLDFDDHGVGMVKSRDFPDSRQGVVGDRVADGTGGGDGGVLAMLVDAHTHFNDKSLACHGRVPNEPSQCIRLLCMVLAKV
jgi:hypothetical protein